MRPTRNSGRWALLAGLAAVLLSSGQAAQAASYTKGDVFVSVSNGQVKEYTPTGTLVQTLDTGLGGYTTGSAFDASGNFYVTDFSAPNVSKFDTTGSLVGAFGSGYSSGPESIVFDQSGNAYVGQASGTGDILKFDSTGASAGSFDTPRTDWIDLGADQCTMYYTGEGDGVDRYDVCTSTAGTEFAGGLPGSNAYALRLLPDGGALVADSDRVVRLDSSGAVVQSYTATGENNLFALNLDPDGTSFWTADFITADVIEFNIATGAVEHQWNTGTGGNTVFGLAVNGELTVAKSESITLAPKTATNPVGTQHCVTASVKTGTDPTSGRVVRFSVSGANTTSGSATTDGSGDASFCYIGTNTGDDTISAFADDNNDTSQNAGEPSDTASKTWTGPLPANLSIAKTDSPDPVVVGATLTYTLSIKNNGPATATGVTVTDHLPAGLSFKSAAPSHGSCTRAGSTVTCHVGSLAAGATATVKIKVVPQSQGTRSNTATVDANEPDPNTGNNTATARTTVNPGVAPPQAGRNVNANVTGDVTVKCPGKPERTLTSKETKVPLGCLFDASNGTVHLWWNDGCASNGRDTGSFGGEPFVPTQASDPGPACATGLMLDLDVRDPQPTDCDTADVSKASIPTGPFRALSHHRHVRSHHHHSGATVRGTQWQVTERCDGTLTRVLDGVVAVRDFTLHKTVLVHAGHSYLARAPGGVLDDDTGSHPGKDWSSGDAR